MTIETVLKWWGCGDEVCGCSKAEVVVEGPHAILPERGMLTRVSLDEGPYHTDGEGVEDDEFRALAKKWDIPLDLKPGLALAGKRPARPREIARYQEAVEKHRAAIGMPRGKAPTWRARE